MGYFEISIDGPVEAIVGGAGVGGESGGEGLEVRKGQIGVDGGFGEVSVEELGDLDDGGAALDGLVQGDEAPDEAEHQLHVEEGPACMAEGGYHQLSEGCLI